MYLSVIISLYSAKNVAFHVSLISLVAVSKGATHHKVVRLELTERADVGDASDDDGHELDEVDPIINVVPRRLHEELALVSLEVLGQLHALEAAAFLGPAERSRFAAVGDAGAWR